MPKVLLVEDNEMNRDMLSRRLSRRGFEVIVAVNGQQGVEMAARELPDIILMDMSLPILDGWGATRLIRQAQSTQSIPVIALTAHAMHDDRGKALEAGCDDYDTKPIDLSRLLDKMERLLAARPKPAAKEPLTAEELVRLRHDVKTAFNQILGYTEMLLEETEETGLQEVAPFLAEFHVGGRALLDRMQKGLAADKEVGFDRLRALETEIRPALDRLCDASNSLTAKLRGTTTQKVVADMESISAAVSLLVSLVQRMRGGAATTPLPSGLETPSLQRPAASTGAGRVLVVEDDDANRNLLLRRLARHGYSVEGAEDGPAALEKISQAQYDLVLLDQMMPGMSGVDLLKLLRATYTATELPVIMVTAVDQSKTVVEALDHGANDYVAKPVDMPVVMARIQAQLARSRADRHTKLSDPLTGLSNRLLLCARLAEAIAQQPRSAAGRMAVLLLDLDGFKVVNDSFGHGTGDQLLLEVAARLKRTIEANKLGDRSTIARIGGDEFVILIEGLESAEPPEKLADSILECLGQPIILHNLKVTVSGSIGIAFGPTEEATPEHLLRNADLAMYRAKELGKNRWQMFEPGMHERVQTRMSIAMDLRHAAEKNELLAVYQPELELRTGAIRGFEALLRWRHPERGLLLPSEIIPVAEETGLIVPIGEWIIAEASRQLARWQKQFPSEPPLTMNVNLSVKQLKDPNLVNHIRRILSETQIPPETLKLELTESSMMAEIESAKEVLASIQSMRVGLKLDDFGTGYSSLSYLRTFHFDCLKIDRSFVERLAADPESRAIVGTIIQLADALRMNVVAEGIETERQLAELLTLGCERGQGFYFSQPLEAQAAEQLLEARYSVQQATRSPAPLIN